MIKTTEELLALLNDETNTDYTAIAQDLGDTMRELPRDAFISMIRTLEDNTPHYRYRATNRAAVKLPTFMDAMRRYAEEAPPKDNRPEIRFSLSNQAALVMMMESAIRLLKEASKRVQPVMLEESVAYLYEQFAEVQRSLQSSVDYVRAEAAYIIASKPRA